MKTKSPAPAPAAPVNPPELVRLGCAVSVRFRGPTETGPARFLARINDGMESVFVSVPYSYSSRDGDELAAAEKCLSRWLLTFDETARPSGFRIHAKGFTGAETLFFFDLAR